MFDKWRTRLRDILFGRTRIRVVSINSAESVKPIFVVGTFRSGTTLLRYLLDTHSKICCPPETKFMVQLANLRNNETTERALESIGLEEDYIKESLREFCSSVYRPYMVSKHKEIVVDKTPEYVRILDFIDWLYDGECQYILIFRNGLDVANSMTTHFIEPLEPDKTIDSAFEYWKHDTEVMLDWIDRKGDACHKVVYDALCERPAEVTQAVCQFIGVDWESEMLGWYREAHDLGYEDAKTRRQRKISVSKGNYETWDPKIVQQLKQRSAKLHGKIGFDPDTLLLR